MTSEQMRDRIISEYPNSTKWLQRVLAMPDYQVFAIYKRLCATGTLRGVDTRPMQKLYSYTCCKCHVTYHTADNKRHTCPLCGGLAAMETEFGQLKL